MTVADDVTLDDLILAKDDLSGADIKVRVSLALHLELRSKTASLVKHVGNSFIHISTSHIGQVRRLSSASFWSVLPPCGLKQNYSIYHKMAASVNINVRAQVYSSLVVPQLILSIITTHSHVNQEVVFYLLAALRQVISIFHRIFWEH